MDGTSIPSPGNLFILSAELGTAELLSRAKLATKPSCCPRNPRPSCHQWEPRGVRRDERLYWPGGHFCLTNSGGPRPCHLLREPWQSTQVKQDQGGAWLGPENPLAPAHGRWEQGVPQMIHWVACCPLSCCQKCLAGTWLGGREYRGGWKATPSGPREFLSRLCACVHMAVSAWSVFPCLRAGQTPTPRSSFQTQVCGEPF